MSLYTYVFGLISNSVQVTSIIGANPVRMWKFGHVPQKQTRPYVSYQRIYGNPDNSLSCVPKEDLAGFQVDCYGTTADGAEELADAVRDTLEGSYTYLVGENGDDWDQPTGLYRVSRTYEVWMARAVS